MTEKEYRVEYERLYAWREWWMRLSNKHEPGRLQSRQDAIERRADIVNRRIGALIPQFNPSSLTAMAFTGRIYLSNFVHPAT